MDSVEKAELEVKNSIALKQLLEIPLTDEERQKLVVILL